MLNSTSHIKSPDVVGISLLNTKYKFKQNDNKNILEFIKSMRKEGNYNQNKYNEEKYNEEKYNEEKYNEEKYNTQ